MKNACFYLLEFWKFLCSIIVADFNVQNKKKKNVKMGGQTILKKIYIYILNIYKAEI